MKPGNENPNSSLNPKHRERLIHIIKTLSIFLIIGVILFSVSNLIGNPSFKIIIETQPLSNEIHFSIYFNEGRGFQEELSVHTNLDVGDRKIEFGYEPNHYIETFRFNLGIRSSMIRIEEINLGKLRLDSDEITNLFSFHGTSEPVISNKVLYLTTYDSNSYLEFQGDSNQLPKGKRIIFFKILSVLLALIFGLFYFKKPEVFRGLFFNREEREEKKSSWKLPPEAWIIASVFLIKAFILAMFIYPISKDPDEIGHYDYITKLAEGELPLIGQTVFEQETVTDWWSERIDNTVYPNWIVQHPPLYHILGAGVWKITDNLTNNKHWLYRTPRLLSVISGAILMLILYLILYEVTQKRWFAGSTTLIFSFIPMVTFMSTGISHDIFLAMIMGFAFLFFFRLLRHRQLKDAILMSIFLALGSATKVTSLVIIAPMVGISFFYLPQKNLSKRLGWILIILLISILPASLWMLRHGILLGNPLANQTNILHAHMDRDLSLPFLEYLRNEMVISHTFRNFFGLFTKYYEPALDTAWIQMTGEHLKFYLITTFTIITFSFWSLIKREMKTFEHRPPYVGFVSIGLIFYLLILHIPSGSLSAMVCYTVIISLLPFAVYSFIWLLMDNRKQLPKLSFDFVKRKPGFQDKVVDYSLIIVFVFALVYLFKLNNLFNFYGELRAAHGRYWYPLIPVLILGFAYPMYKTFHPKKWLVIGFILGYGLMEVYYTLTMVLPFYGIN